MNSSVGSELSEIWRRWLVPSSAHAAPSGSSLGVAASAAATAAVEAPASVDDLSLIEKPVAQGDAALPVALILTGDGGWAGLDRGMTAEFGARGLPVVGLSTLKYYWKARTPEESARDVARVMNQYLRLWKRQRVVLIGYSFGANVLPFIVNRLPLELRARYASMVRAS